MTVAPGDDLQLQPLMLAKVLVSLTLTVLLMAQDLRPCSHWLHPGDATLPLVMDSPAVNLSLLRFMPHGSACSFWSLLVHVEKIMF